MKLLSWIIIVFSFFETAAADTAINLTPTNCVVINRNFKAKHLNFGDLQKSEIKTYSYVCKTKDFKKLNCKDGNNHSFDFEYSRGTDDKKDISFDHVESGYIFGSLNINKVFNSFSYDGVAAGDYKKGLRSNVICTGSFSEI